MNSENVKFFFEEKRDYKKCKNIKMMSCLQRLYKRLKVDILNFFNPESAIKNKLKYFLSELRGFKFVTHCFYRLKIGSKNVTKYSNFY